MSTIPPAATPRAGSATNSLSAAASGPPMRMLWQNTSTGDRSIWSMNGPNWGGSYVSLPQVPIAWSIVGSGDFNGDGQADILWQNTATGDRSIWFMSGNAWAGTYALLPQVPVQWSIAGVGDFNGDGKPDLVWQNTTTGDRSIWFMNGSTWRGSYALLPNVSTQWSIAAISDFNGDGKPDLVWQNTTTGERSIWFMNGSTWSGSYALLPTVPTSWKTTAAADFDGDDKPDLVWQNTVTGDRSIWIMSGSTWAGNYALLPTVPMEWSIAGMFATTSVLDLLPHFSYGESLGSIKVFSDISPSFSHDHAVNLDKTWRYYTSFFGASPGTHLEMYYSLDSATYVSSFKYCPGVWYLNAREVNACWNVYGDGAWMYFVIPYVIPDYGTQYHEISHIFLQKVHPDAENFPWLKEGSGMYFESGSFDAAGNFSVSMPLAYVRQGFHQYDSQNALIPLATLLTMSRNDFYSGLNAGNAVKTYSQSGLFFTFLMKQYPTVMSDMFAQFRQGGLPVNIDVLTYITSHTGRTIAQLEQDYIAYGRSLP